MTAAALDNDITDIIELIDAVLADWQGIPEEDREGSMATVPMYPLVGLVAMALLSLKGIDPQPYYTLLAKYKLQE